MFCSILLFATVQLTAGYQEFNNDNYIGIPNFENIVKSTYYVDKTLLIETFLRRIYGPHEFITAPRNFGKTVNLQMLKHFLEIEVDENGNEILNKTLTSNYQLFTKTKIFKEKPEMFDVNFGKYPVIYIDYSCLRSVSSYDVMIEKMKDILLNTFREHRYLLKVEDVWKEDLDILEFKEYVVGRLNLNLSKVAIQRGFIYLAHVLERCFLRQPVILIDDYDAIFNSIILQNSKDVDAIISFFHEIHGHVLKLYEPSVQKVFCSGVLPIIDLEIPSGERDLKYNLFSFNHTYSSYYGLSEDELTEMLTKYTRNADERKQIKSQIDSFYFAYNRLGNKGALYNIFSVVSYLRNRRLGDAKALRSYYAKPRFYFPLLNMFYKVSVQIMTNNLIQGRPSTVPKGYKVVSKKCIITLKEMLHDKDGDAVKSTNELFHKLLLHYGYLTYIVAKESPDKPILLCIPNKEMESELQNILKDSVMHRFNFHSDTVDSINDHINSISKTNSSIEQFRSLTSEIHELFSDSDYVEDTEYDFQLTLISIIKPEFKRGMKFEMFNEDCQSDITLRNNKNVTFLIKTETKHRKTRIAVTEMRNTTEKGLREIIRKGYIDDVHPSLRENVVYMCICFGFVDYKDGNVNTLLSITYSKNLTSNDNLNVTTSLYTDDWSLE